jgi:hypothetical protein
MNDVRNDHKKHQLGLVTITEECVDKAEVILAVKYITEETTEQLPNKFGYAQTAVLEVSNYCGLDFLQNLLDVLNNISIGHGKRFK